MGLVSVSCHRIVKLKRRSRTKMKCKTTEKVSNRSKLINKQQSLSMLCSRGWDIGLVPTSSEERLLANDAPTLSWWQRHRTFQLQVSFVVRLTFLFECSSCSSTAIILFAFVLERWTRMWSTTRWKRSNATPKINTSTTKTLRLTSWVTRPLMTSSWIELQRHNDNHNIVTICICCTGIVTKHDNKVFKLNYDLDVARSLMKWGQSGSSLAKWAVRYLFVKQKLNIKKYNVQFI